MSFVRVVAAINGGKIKQVIGNVLNAEKSFRELELKNVQSAMVLVQKKRLQPKRAQHVMAQEANMFLHRVL